MIVVELAEIVLRFDERLKTAINGKSSFFTVLRIIYTKRVMSTCKRPIKNPIIAPSNSTNLNSRDIIW